MPNSYSLYALELEPVKDKNAKWYVGITEDVDRRWREHNRSWGVPWVMRNEVVDHVVIGEWRERKARKYEDILTALLMDEYGYLTARGGNYTHPTEASVPNIDISDLPHDLLRALAETDHEGLYTICGNHPLFEWRKSATDGRADTGELLLYDDTADSSRRAHEHLESRLGSDLNEHDVREAIYIAGMKNIRRRGNPPRLES